MNRLLISPIRPHCAPATVVLAALLASMAQASEKAEFSTPTGKSASSLAPVKPADDGSALSNPFDRSKSQIPAADGGPTASPQAGPVMDAKTRLRLLDAWDRKQNWMLNADRPQTGPGTDKEADPVTKLQGHRPTALERRILEENPTKAKRSAGRSDKTDYVWNDPASDRDRQLKADGSAVGGRFGGLGKDGNGDPTGVGSPWDTSTSGKLMNDEDGSGFRQPGFNGFRSGSFDETAARMGQVLNGGSALPGLQGNWAALANQETGSAGRIQSLLGGAPNVVSGVAGLFTAPAETRLATPPAFLQSSTPGVSGLGSPLAPAPAPRPEHTIMQPQPNVLPFPSRDF